MANQYLVDSPYSPFTIKNQFKAISNGKVYIGEVDKDPLNPSQQIQVYVVDETGSNVPVSQPIQLNAGGYLVYNGQVSKFITLAPYSMVVLSSVNAEMWRVDDISKVDPDNITASNVKDTTNGRSVQDFIDDNDELTDALLYVFDTVADYKASNIEFPVGKTIHLNDRDADFEIIIGVSMGNDRDIISNSNTGQSCKLIFEGILDTSKLGGGWGAVLAAWKLTKRISISPSSAPYSCHEVLFHDGIDDVEIQGNNAEIVVPNGVPYGVKIDGANTSLGSVISYNEGISAIESQIVVSDTSSLSVGDIVRIGSDAGHEAGGLLGEAVSVTEVENSTTFRVTSPVFNYNVLDNMIAFKMPNTSVNINGLNITRDKGDLTSSGTTSNTLVQVSFIVDPIINNMRSSINIGVGLALGGCVGGTISKFHSDFGDTLEDSRYTQLNTYNIYLVNCQGTEVVNQNSSNSRHMVDLTGTDYRHWTADGFMKYGLCWGVTVRDSYYYGGKAAPLSSHHGSYACKFTNNYVHGGSVGAGIRGHKHEVSNNTFVKNKIAVNVFNNIDTRPGKDGPPTNYVTVKDNKCIDIENISYSFDGSYVAAPATHYLEGGNSRHSAQFLRARNAMVIVDGGTHTMSGNITTARPIEHDLGSTASADKIGLKFYNFTLNQDNTAVFGGNFIVFNMSGNTNRTLVLKSITIDIPTNTGPVAYIANSFSGAADKYTHFRIYDVICTGPIGYIGGVIQGKSDADSVSEGRVRGPVHRGNGATLMKTTTNS